ncbi:MAG TPA: DUF4232 domain-containing protein [Pseudonocardiaceae bacterium]|nr:DUF4232 domain-containing protein [Pseudonocardiaceae bacterium]
MNSTRRMVTGAIAVGGALAAIAVAGCGPSAATTAAPSTTDAPTSAIPFTAVPSIDSSAVPSATRSAPAGTATPAAAPLPECKANTLSLAFGPGDAGMNQQERVLRFTNRGRATCAIVGFPGVSYVTGDDGRQVGQAAVRTGRIGAQVDLAPGASAYTIVHSVDPGVFDPAQCKPVAVRGLRVYAPDDTAAMFIPLPSGAQGCTGPTTDAQLSVVTVKAGPGRLG